jgi:hypothetical protein
MLRRRLAGRDDQRREQGRPGLEEGAFRAVAMPRKAHRTGDRRAGKRFKKNQSGDQGDQQVHEDHDDTSQWKSRVVRTIERAAHEMNQKRLKSGRIVKIASDGTSENLAKRLTAGRGEEAASSGGYYLYGVGGWISGPVKNGNWTRCKTHVPEGR